MAKRVELLREIIPKASRVAVLFDPANPVESLAMRELVTAAEALGVKVQAFAARTPEEVITSPQRPRQAELMRCGHLATPPTSRGGN